MKMFALTAALALAAGAAAAQPADVKTMDGAYADADGKALYTWDNDTMKGMSHCRDRCAEMWPPLIAKAGAEAQGDWTLIRREDGSQQWAYKDKPLYTFVRDAAGKPGAGEAIKGWHLAK